ncbi:GTP-binding protein [Geodermatophilus sp. DSM 45219]|uniref:CobW family GTP-binding protein n=1 Tax=Geodermatophilus sp. DSM 45219 TaxID=1881103 RepID=UPI00088D3302|nr:GTP-binding protein [Geodermatophilus sp. DSM 45219]SDO22846.1 GTPase, G3E family [Geodermatophilus sp. DSM 45219]
MSVAGVRPLTVVSGALGSGKTTLLRDLLTRPDLRSTAVLVNELGEIGLDHHQLRHVDERTVVLPGGCVCCATRSDVESALHELLATEEAGHVDPVRRVLLETTGLADPAPVVATLLASPTLRHHFAVDRVVVTVDAQAVARDADQGAEWLQQVVCADLLVLTKTDLVTAAAARELAARLRRLNPAAPVVSRAEIDLAATRSVPAAAAVPPLPADRHLSGVASTSVTLDGPVDWAAFAVWVSALLHAHGDRILRMKALLDTGGDEPVVLDAVQHVVHPPRHLPRWDGPRASSLVVITRDLPPERVVAALQRFLGRRRPAAAPAGGDRVTPP